MSASKEKFLNNIKRIMRQAEADRYARQKSLEDLTEKLEQYYEIDLDNCTMTHKDWIEELAKAMTSADYHQNFLNEFKEYQEARGVEY